MPASHAFCQTSHPRVSSATSSWIPVPQASQTATASLFQVQAYVAGRSPCGNTTPAGLGPAHAARTRPRPAARPDRGTGAVRLSGSAEQPQFRLGPLEPTAYRAQRRVTPRCPVESQTRGSSQPHARRLGAADHTRYDLSTRSATCPARSCCSATDRPPSPFLTIWHANPTSCSSCSTQDRSFPPLSTPARHPDPTKWPASPAHGLVAHPPNYRSDHRPLFADAALHSRSACDRSSAYATAANPTAWMSRSK